MIGTFVMKELKSLQIIIKSITLAKNKMIIKANLLGPKGNISNEINNVNILEIFFATKIYS